MLNINRIMAATAIVLSFCSNLALASNTGSIILHISGLRNNNGVVRVALFDSSKNYSMDKGSADHSFKKMIAPINNKESTATIENLPYGEYAIKLFHDEDNSGRFLTNSFGIPKVEYGFSNNAHGLFGPAPFDKAKFRLDSQKLDMNIKMQGN